ncbi:hypothetical protein [Streptomyces sp. NPDC093568]|uniref:hypothetical protein n=1 Tax=Streptomyces sp. NPDC093568 TaxID=3366041 RepID=UPI00381D2E50
MIAVIGGLVWVTQWMTRDSPVEKEQKQVEQLSAGQTFALAIEIMDGEPHCTQSMASGNRLYQYCRKCKLIQLFVDRDDIASCPWASLLTAQTSALRSGSVTIG